MNAETPTAIEVGLVAHAAGMLELVGLKPSIRQIDAIIKATYGKHGMRWATISAALKLLPGNTAGNTPATLGQQFDEEPATAEITPPTRVAAAPADHSRVVYDSAQGLDTNPYPPSPSQPEPIAAVAPPDAPVPLFAVPDLPAKPAKLTVAAQDPNTDFGAFEPDVVAMVVVEQARHPRKKPAEAVIRQRLALLWRKNGDAAFGRGLEVGVSSGYGVNYGRAVMERYDPETEGRRFERPEPVDASSALPTLTELIAAGKVKPVNNRAVIAERPAWFNQQLAVTA